MKNGMRTTLLAILSLAGVAAFKETVSASSSFQGQDELRVQDFSLNELHTDKARFEQVLKEDGILTISLGGGNDLLMRRTQERAFEAASSCLGHRDPSGKESVLDDGRTKRYSLASKTSYGVSIPLIGLPNGRPESRRDCAGVNAEVAPLRTMVGLVGEEVLRAMDSALSSSSAPYVLKTRSNEADVKTFAEIARSSEQLEHYHMMVLESEEDMAEEGTEEGGQAIHMHTDNGLFILMTAGHFYASESSGRWTPREASLENDLHHGLHVKRADGTVVRATLENQGRGRLIFMAGEAMRQWTHPRVGNAIRTVPHAVVLPKKSDVDGEEIARLWYGRMFLPPGNAIVSKDENGVQEETRTFAEYRAENVKAIAEINAAKRAAADMLARTESKTTTPRPFPKTTASFRGLSSGTCTSDQLWCWNQCMDSSSLSCGMHETIECSSDDTTVDCSTTHDMSCEPQCVAMSMDDDNSTTTSSSFCTGSGTSMYMDGFNSFLSENASEKLCVNLWFVDWTLDSDVKFAFAGIGVCVFGIFVEWLRSVQRSLLLKNEGVHYLFIVGIRGLQLTVGYFAMLIAMTYQTELFIMLIIGLTVGWARFNMPPPDSEKGYRVSAAEDTMPCCEIGDGKRARKAIEKKSNGHSTENVAIATNGVNVGAMVVPASASPLTNTPSVTAPREVPSVL